MRSTKPSWSALGDEALWAPRPERPQEDKEAGTLALCSALRACDGVLDAVVTEDRLCVYFDPPRLPRGLDDALERATLESAESPRDIVLRARYDGPDLDGLTALTGLSREEIIRAHAAGSYVVRVMGFLPGFAYLGGLDSRLVVPRRGVPRPRVEAGSVAIAAEYTGVYPFASPGGWHIVGHAVDAELFRTDAGARLRLGDRVRFERVG
jgi:UPF0271 protein